MIFQFYYFHKNVLASDNIVYDYTVEYNKLNVKLSYTQFKKLKATLENKTETTLIICLKMFDGNDLCHELLLTTRQKTKLRNAFNNNMKADINFSNA